MEYSNLVQPEPLKMTNLIVPNSQYRTEERDDLLELLKEFTGRDEDLVESDEENVPDSEEEDQASDSGASEPDDIQDFIWPSPGRKLYGLSTSEPVFSTNNHAFKRKKTRQEAPNTAEVSHMPPARFPSRPRDVRRVRCSR